MTNFTLSITSSTFLAAARKYSGPFCMVIRPRNRTIFSSLWMGIRASEPLPLDVDGVVDHLDLVGSHAVAVDADVLGQVADGDDLVGPVHAGALDVVDALVDVLAAAVELGGVDVDDQRLAGMAATARPAGIGDRVERCPSYADFISRIPTHLRHPAADHCLRVGVCMNFALSSSTQSLSRHTSCFSMRFSKNVPPAAHPAPMRSAFDPDNTRSKRAGVRVGCV